MALQADNANNKDEGKNFSQENLDTNIIQCTYKKDITTHYKLAVSHKLSNYSMEYLTHTLFILTFTVAWDL